MQATHIFQAKKLRCKLTDSTGPQRNRPCIFPFAVNGRVYNECGCFVPFNSTHQQECSKKPHRDDVYWCSTKVDANGEHVPRQNEYGHCDKNCKQHKEDVAEGKPFQQTTSSDSLTNPAKLDVVRHPSAAVVFPGDIIVTQRSSATPNARIATTTTQTTTTAITTMRLHVTSNRRKTTHRSTTSKRLRDTTTRRTTTYLNYLLDDRHEIKDSSSGTWLPTLDGPNGVECGVSTRAGYILGGEDAKVGEFPFIAALGFIP